MSLTIINKQSTKEISQRKMETYEKYSQVINWGRAYPVEFASRFMGVELLDLQKYAIYNSWFSEFICWLESRNAGKALSTDTLIPTPLGIKTMGNICVGDYVYDIHKQLTMVLAVSETFYDHQCYKVYFEDGEVIVADADHLWSVYINGTDNRLRPVDEFGFTILSTQDMVSDYVQNQFGNIPKYKYAVPMYEPVIVTHHNKQNLKTIVKIEETKSVPTKCIRVDNSRGLFLCGEHNTVTHNSTKLAIYTMLRSLLIPFHATYFLGNTGEQAKETFKKIEKLAKREIESFTGCTDIFFNELVRNGSTSDGFVHNPASFVCELFNGANINTLNSDIVNIKGKRANLVCFDEAGWFSDELFVQAENFVNQDENFKLGGNIDIRLEPKGFPRQLMYASSASDTSSEFYKKFKTFSQQMIMGNRKYFACNFTIDAVMAAKFNGDPYPPLISKDKVDKALSDNHDKAMRELYNKFSADNHEGQILSRRDIMCHTVNRPPLLCNDTGNRLFAFSWDSARLNDNSVIIVAEFIQDEEIGWRMDLHNVVSLVDISTKKKTPKRIPEQVADFKQLLLNYNGSEKGKLDYENIKAIISDSGAGGQMVGGISDYLVEDWVGNDGKKHKGIIDRNHKANETAKNKYPNAVDIMKLVDPKGNRNAIFDSIEKMVKLGVVTFPAEYNDKDYLYYIEDDGTEVKYDLSMEEKLSLAQFELLKTEIVTMCKYENAGNVSYNFPPDKRNTMHDDRVFAFGLLCYYLAQLRHGEVINKPKITVDYSKLTRCVSNISF